MYRKLGFAAAAGLLAGLASIPVEAASVTTTQVCQTTIPSASRQVHGSGRFVRRPIATSSFTRIDVDGAAELEIVVGPRPSVEVEVDDNLTGLMHAEAAGGVLRLHSEGSYCTTRVPRFRITTPALAQVELGGSGDTKISGLSGGDLRIVISGSSNVGATGAVDSVEIDLDGSGDVDLTQLQAPTVAATINGSGTVNIGSAHTLSAVVNGSGDIHYAGNPTVLNQAVHGSGRIWRH